MIAASAMVSDINVEIEQAKGVPGTAVIMFVDNITLEKNTYYLNFDVQSTSDEFNSATVGNQWQWVRENQACIQPYKECRFPYNHQRKRRCIGEEQQC